VSILIRITKMTLRMKRGVRKVVIKKKLMKNLARLSKNLENLIRNLIFFKMIMIT